MSVNFKTIKQLSPEELRAVYKYNSKKIINLDEPHIFDFNEKTYKVSVEKYFNQTIYELLDEYIKEEGEYRILLDKRKTISAELKRYLKSEKDHSKHFYSHGSSLFFLEIIDKPAVQKNHYIKDYNDAFVFNEQSVCDFDDYLYYYISLYSKKITKIYNKLYYSYDGNDPPEIDSERFKHFLNFTNENNLADLRAFFLATVNMTSAEFFSFAKKASLKNDVIKKYIGIEKNIVRSEYCLDFIKQAIIFIGVASTVKDFDKSNGEDCSRFLLQFKYYDLYIDHISGNYSLIGKDGFKIVNCANNGAI